MYEMILLQETSLMCSTNILVLMVKHLINIHRTNI